MTRDLQLSYLTLFPISLQHFVSLHQPMCPCVRPPIPVFDTWSLHSPLRCLKCLSYIWDVCRIYGMFVIYLGCLSYIYFWHSARNDAFKTSVALLLLVIYSSTNVSIYSQALYTAFTGNRSSVQAGRCLIIFTGIVEKIPLLAQCTLAHFRV